MEDYKEKYEQTLERARKLYNEAKANEYTQDLADYETIFPELKESEDERIKNFLIGYFDKLIDENSEWGLEKETRDRIIDWLEKQGKEEEKVSIWKHWKDGIIGNGEGKQVYLIKYGNEYSLSSCLGCECDYIMLSELDNILSQRKQGEQKPAWSEEDEHVFNELVAFLEEGKHKLQHDLTMYAHWLKSLKERMKGK